MLPFRSPGLLLPSADILRPQEVFRKGIYLGSSYSPSRKIELLDPPLNTTTADGSEGAVIFTKMLSSSEGYSAQPTVMNNSLMGRGYTSIIEDNDQPPFDDQSGLLQFLTDGYTLGTSTYYNSGYQNANVYRNLVFKKKAKFFDAFIYDGNGFGDRVIPHSLGHRPGLVVVECMNGGGHMPAAIGFDAYNGDSFRFNGSDRQNNKENGLPNYSYGYIEGVTATGFRVADGGYGVNEVNGMGAKYLAMAFGNDPSPDGIIRCGVKSGVNPGEYLYVDGCGWEPQLIMGKPLGQHGGWRVFCADRPTKSFYLNYPQTEDDPYWYVTSEGFYIPAWHSNTYTDYFWMAIRKDI